MENIIQRTSISQQVMDHILNLVDSGKLHPGDRLQIGRASCREGV